MWGSRISRRSRKNTSRIQGRPLYAEVCAVATISPDLQLIKEVRRLIAAPPDSAYRAQGAQFHRRKISKPGDQRRLGADTQRREGDAPAIHRDQPPLSAGSPRVFRRWRACIATSSARFPDGARFSLRNGPSIPDSDNATISPEDAAPRRSNCGQRMPEHRNTDIPPGSACSQPGPDL